MTRHWTITDLDGKNPRHVDLKQYIEAMATGAYRLDDYVFPPNRHCHWTDRVAPMTLDQAAKALANI
jgi:hypothetical protein